MKKYSKKTKVVKILRNIQVTFNFLLRLLVLQLFLLNEVKNFIFLNGYIQPTQNSKFGIDVIKISFLRTT